MTKRFLFYVLVAVATLCLVMYIRNPDMLNRIWLWLVGLFGTMAFYIQSLWKALEAKLASTAQSIHQERESKRNAAKPAPSTVSPITGNTPTTPVNVDTTRMSVLEQQLKVRDAAIEELESKLRLVHQTAPKAIDPFNGTTVHLLRYLDDGETTLGLLYIDETFFCYTLEDTYRPVKISGRTRIPQGDFAIKYLREDTPLTLKYRDKPFARDWFTYHLHVQNVPGFEGIYIHSGGDHHDTEGCILVSDGLSSTAAKKTFTNSKKTFELLYKRLAEDLDRDVPVRIRIYDEKWFTQTMIPSLP